MTNEECITLWQTFTGCRWSWLTCIYILFSVPTGATALGNKKQSVEESWMQEEVEERTRLRSSVTCFTSYIICFFKQVLPLRLWLCHPCSFFKFANARDILILIITCVHIITHTPLFFLKLLNLKCNSATHLTTFMQFIVLSLFYNIMIIYKDVVIL